jgi:hypothetical protein
VIGQAGRKSRTNILIAIIAVLMVCGFWAVFLPRTQVYRTYRSERRIEATLRSLQPPPETVPMTVHALHVEKFVVGMGDFVTSSPVENIKAHYRTELTRHGFMYTGETTTGSQVSEHFCGNGYEADLSVGKPIFPPAGIPQQTKGLQMYTIFIHERSGAC